MDSSGSPHIFVGLGAARSVEEPVPVDLQSGALVKMRAWHRSFDKVEVLLLSVEPDDRPAAIFETLNSRGRRVSPTDLVRNLFNFVRDIDSKAVELARQVWSYVSKLFDEDDLKQFLSVFVLRDS